MAEPKMPEVPDYYFDLGLEISACNRDIRVAYLRLAQQHHPDKRGSAESVDAIEFRKVNEAYCFLRDERQRKEYDETYTNIIKNWANYRAKYTAWVKKKEITAQAKESAKEAAEQKKKLAIEAKAKKTKETVDEKKKLAAEAKTKKAKEAAEKKKAAECAKEMKKFQAEQKKKEREARARKFREAQEEREKNEATEDIKQGGGNQKGQDEKEEPLRTDARYQEYLNRQKQKEKSEDTQHTGDRKRADSVHSNAENERLEEKQRQAEERSRQAAERAQQAQAEAAKERLRNQQPESPTSDIPRNSKRNFEDSTSEDPSLQSERPKKAQKTEEDNGFTLSRNVKIIIAKEWAQTRHKAYLKKNGLKGHESSVADAYIELDWVKETAVKKCDDCTRKCKHFQYRCPSGGLVVCPPCKARYSCYGA